MDQGWAFQMTRLEVRVIGIWDPMDIDSLHCCARSVLCQIVECICTCATYRGEAGVVKGTIRNSGNNGAKSGNNRRNYGLNMVVE